MRGHCSDPRRFGDDVAKFQQSKPESRNWNLSLQHLSEFLLSNFALTPGHWRDLAELLEHGIEGLTIWPRIGIQVLVVLADSFVPATCHMLMIRLSVSHEHKSP
jgi:hypothetical protein